MDISKLSKAELVKNNEKLVQEFLIKQGYEVIKVLGDKVLYNEKGKFYYLEFEIGETLKNLPMSSVTGEDKFEKMWYFEQDKRVDIEIIEETKDDKTVRYPNFKVTKNITLWVWEATGGGGPGKV